MTLSLYVLRHAKAEADSASGGDHGRELKRRGRKAAAEVGRFLTRLGELPGLVLASDAARARDTARLAIDAGGWKTRLELRPELYSAGAEALARAVAQHGSETERVLLVGHEPSLSQLITLVTGAEVEFPTAALARVDLAVERWRELAPRRGRLMWLVTPEIVALERPAD